MSPDHIHGNLNIGLSSVSDTHKEIFRCLQYSGAPNDGFLPNALKRCFRLSGVLLSSVD